MHTDAPQIDVNAALARMGGDRQLFKDICGFFHEDAFTLLDQIDAALEQRNLSELERGAHSLKGLVANFGAPQIVESLRDVERAAATADWKQIAQSVRPARTQIEQLDATLKQFRNV